MASNILTATGRVMAGLGLTARVLVWLLMLPLCGLWLLVAMAYDTATGRPAQEV